MNQIIEKKFEQGVSARKLGDEISYFLSSLNIINILSIEKKFEIKNKKKVINSWNFLLKEGVELIFNTTIQEYPNSGNIEIENLSKDLTKNNIQLLDFNKKFKLNKATNYFYQNHKTILLNFIKSYDKQLSLYLNEKIIKEVELNPKIKGGIAYLK